MKRASVSINMLVVIVIAITAMTIFILFFTGKSAGLFSQFSKVSPSESDTDMEVCQIACNNAKISKSCLSWCNKLYGEGPEKCYEKMECNFKDAEGKLCTCP